MILEKRRRTIDDLADLSGVSWSSCQRILREELQMKRVAAKFMPHVLG
jgi:predicted DNA binding protein